LPPLLNIKVGKYFTDFLCIFKGCEILFDTAVGKHLCGVMLKMVMNTFVNSVQIFSQKSG